VVYFAYGKGVMSGTANGVDPFYEEKSQCKGLVFEQGMKRQGNFGMDL